MRSLRYIITRTTGVNRSIHYVTRLKGTTCLSIVEMTTVDQV